MPRLLPGLACATGPVATLLALPGCDPAPPDSGISPEAAALLAEVRAADYQSWPHPREWPEHMVGSSPHGLVSDVWLDPLMSAAVTAANIVEWPEGATIVSDGYDEAAELLVAIQIMRKRDGAWTWAQYAGDGTPLVYGTSLACSHCHAAGADFVRSVELPDSQ